MRSPGLSFPGLTLAVLSVLVVVQACGERDKSPPLSPLVTSTGSGGGGGFNANPGGGPCVEAGVCGNEIHQLALDVPNLYFVFDRSGSMAELEPPDYETRYEIVREAAIALITSLGPLINPGAAVFPHGNIDADPCTSGDQVFPVTPGDPIEDDGSEGPVALDFRFTTKLTPKGGTPIAATLDEIRPTLAELNGRTIVLLLTDGGPNCNEDAVCTIDECISNIEGLCPGPENCCTPGHAQGGPFNCLDRGPTVTAIEAIAALGIDVYVIGITGSELYEAVLDDMAVAGGTAQSSDTLYHKVDDLTALTEVFAEIAADAISCEIELADPPDEEEKALTNVHMDCDLVPYDAVHGWTWLEEDTVWLHGDACDKLKSGQVSQVQIATGCPTELPK